MRANERRLPNVFFDPPADLCTAIGELALRWNSIVYQLQVMLRVISRQSKDHQYKTLTALREEELRRRLLKVPISDHAIRRQLKRFVQEVGRRQTMRGNAVHQFYGYWQSPKERVKFQLNAPNSKAGRPHGINDAVKTVKADCERLRALQLEADRITDLLKGVFYKNYVAPNRRR